MTNHNKQTTTADIKRKYDKGINNYRRVIGAINMLGVGRLRREILKEVRGETIEIAVGTGSNLASYPKDARLVAMDLSRAMLYYASLEAAMLGMNVSFSIMDAENVACPDGSFDTVVDTLTLCTFINPLKALREMGRICKPDGRILLLEHGKSDNRFFARLQEWQNPGYCRNTGCSLLREPLNLIEEAGLKVETYRRTFMGVFYLIVATP